jgi:copper ion binding protein
MSDTVTTLGVRGMTCGNCVRHVEKAVRDVPGVRDVAVDLEGGQVRVTHAAGADVDAMVKAIDEAGYEAGFGASGVA